MNDPQRSPGAPQPEVPIPKDLVRLLMFEPDEVATEDLGEFLSDAQVERFGVARDREAEVSSRIAAVMKLGLEGATVGELDLNGIRARVRQLLRALRGREELDPDDSSGRVLVAVDDALSRCS